MSETLYGRNAVYEALRARRREPHRLLVAKGVRETGIIEQILQLAKEIGVPVERVDRGRLNDFGPFSHQGVALEASPYAYTPLEELFGVAASGDDAPFLLLLDLLKDPHNVGSLLRTAEAVGVHGVVIQERRAVDITPTVGHTSAGAVEHVRVAQVTNLVRAIEWLKDQRVWVAGLDAVPGAQPYDDADLTGSLAVVVGSEGRGMRRLVGERCDFLVQLPMRGRVTSLNASVAGSVILYEALRQRRGSG